MYTFFVGEPEGKRPLGRPRRRLVDNIRMCLWGFEGCIMSWWGNRRESDHWEDIGLDLSIILEWICGKRAVCIALVGKPEAKRLLERPRLILVNNIRIDM
jgi:hypothetical protein